MLFAPAHQLTALLQRKKVRRERECYMTKYPFEDTGLTSLSEAELARSQRPLPI
jgi:hypothetical protein